MHQPKTMAIVFFYHYFRHCIKQANVIEYSLRVMQTGG